jgi:hypothetical protein
LLQQAGEELRIKIALAVLEYGVCLGFFSNQLL